MLSASLSLSAYASSKTPGKVIAGWVEKVTLLNSRNTLKAKLDTGAATSSIYALNVDQYKKDGKRWVKFDLVVGVDDDKKPKMVSMDSRRVRRVKIKEHDGEYDSRPVVELGICFNGLPYNAQFTLADRGNFVYPVLLGRRFLEGLAVIDPQQTFQIKADCEPNAIENR